MSMARPRRTVVQSKHLASLALPFLMLTGLISAQVELPVSTPAANRVTYSEQQPVHAAAPLPPPPGVLASSAAPQMQTLDAVQVLESCIHYLQAQKAFYTELTCTSTLTISGMERTNSSRSRVWLRRPDRVVWTTQGESGSNAMAIDGRNCTLYLPSLSKYTVTALGADDTVDDRLSPMVSPFGQLTAALLSADLTPAKLAEVMSGTPTAMQPEELYGVPCYHLLVPLQGGVNTELWVAMGPAAVPVHLYTAQTLPPAAGQSGADSRLEVDFAWKVNVDLPDATFRLNLPASAQKVDQLGGPNLAAANWKPSTGKSVRKKGRPIDPVISDMQNLQRDVALAATPEIKTQVLTQKPPRTGSNTTVPSLSEGLGASQTNMAPKQTPLVAVQGQTQQLGTPAAQGIWRRPNAPSTQNFQAPITGSMSAPVTKAVASAPDVELPLLNGGTIRLSDLRGKKAVVLDFWATWCGPCKQAMPAVAEVAQAWRGRGVEFYAVNMAEDSGTVQAFAKQQGLSIPVALDSGRAAQAFGVSGIPHLVVIGRDGTIRSVHTGATPDLKQTLTQELQSAVR
ncbi:MAG: redoxin domain-containing protein [Candidatus Sumerlaeaceae bacterium]